MSGKAFTTKNTVVIRDNEGNFFTIKEKLDFGARARLKGTLAQGLVQTADGEVQTVMDMGLYQVILCEEGIVAWGGEEFLDDHGKLKEVNKANIRELNDEWPLFQEVLTELANRNKKAMQGSSPNDQTTSGTSDAEPSVGLTESTPEK